MTDPIQEFADRARMEAERRADELVLDKSGPASIIRTGQINTFVSGALWAWHDRHEGA